MFRKQHGRWFLVLTLGVLVLMLAVACATPTTAPVPTAAPASSSSSSVASSAASSSSAPAATKAPASSSSSSAASSAASSGAASSAASSSAISDADLAKEADFYKGKNADFVIPYATGGGYDTWVRLLAPYMKKYTGANWVPKNVPGAGSIVGTNQIYAAEPNGLTIGIINGVGVTQAQLTDTSGVQFDLAKFTYIGRITSDQRILTVSSKGKYKSIDDIRKATDKVKFGAPGPGSSNFVESVLIGTALGVKIDMITGYDVSDEVDLAVARGEIDVAAGSYASKLPMLKSGDLIPILQYGKDKIADLPNVPMLTELPNVDAKGKELIALALALGEVGRPIVGPPGIPAARAKFLEIAMKKSLEDPELLALAGKQKMDVLYLSSADTSAMAKTAAGLTPTQKKELQDLLKQYTPAKK